MINIYLTVGILLLISNSIFAQSSYNFRYDLNGNRIVTVRHGSKPGLSLISGQDSQIQYEDNGLSIIYTYNVPPMDGSTYSWNIISGQIVNPSTSSEVQIKWFLNPQTTKGFLYVIETNSAGCSSDTAKFEVNLVNALPVILKSFTGNHVNDGNMLKWTTSRETDNSRFIVQRSDNGVIFTDIASLDGNGSSNEDNNYEFLDKFCSMNLNYYRLRQIDFDGSLHMSHIIVIDAGPADNLIAYPNPFSSELTIKLPLKNEEIVQTTIYDLNGYVVHKSNALTTNKAIHINTEYLPVGNYEIVIQSSGVFIKKFTVKM